MYTFAFMCFLEAFEQSKLVPKAPYYHDGNPLYWAPL